MNQTTVGGCGSLPILTVNGCEIHLDTRMLVGISVGNRILGFLKGGENKMGISRFSIYGIRGIHSKRNSINITLPCGFSILGSEWAVVSIVCLLQGATKLPLWLLMVRRIGVVSHLSTKQGAHIQTIEERYWFKTLELELQLQPPNKHKTWIAHVSKVPRPSNYPVNRHFIIVGLQYQMCLLEFGGSRYPQKDT